MFLCVFFLLLKPNQVLILVHVEQVNSDCNESNDDRMLFVVLVDFSSTTVERPNSVTTQTLALRSLRFLSAFCFILTAPFQMRKRHFARYCVVLSQDSIAIVKSFSEVGYLGCVFPPEVLYRKLSLAIYK